MSSNRNDVEQITGGYFNAEISQTKWPSTGKEMAKCKWQAFGWFTILEHESQ